MSEGRKQESSAIVGASRPSQVDDNAAASGIELDAATLGAIDEALAGIRREFDDD